MLFVWLGYGYEVAEPQHEDCGSAVISSIKKMVKSNWCLLFDDCQDDEVCEQKEDEEYADKEEDEVEEDEEEINQEE